MLTQRLAAGPLRRLGQGHPHPEMRDTTTWEVFEAERPSLVPYAGTATRWTLAPSNRSLEIRAYAELVVLWQDGLMVSRHGRVFGRERAIYEPLHYIPVLFRNPGVLRNGAPFRDWDLPPAIRRIQRKLERVLSGDRKMVEILATLLSAGLDAVDAACAEALDESLHSTDVIFNILAPRREPEPPRNIAAPDAHKLSCESTADCAHYDTLRRTDYGKITAARRNEPAQA